VSIAGGSDLLGLGSAEYVFVPAEILKSKESDKLPSNPYFPLPLEIIITQVTKENQNTPFGSMKVATGIIFDAAQSNKHVLE